MIKWIFSHLDLRPPPQLNLYIAGRKRICYLSLIMPCDQLQPSGDHICHLIKKRLKYSLRFLSLGKKVVLREEFYLRKVRTHFVFLRKSPSSKMIFLTRDFLKISIFYISHTKLKFRALKVQFPFPFLDAIGGLKTVKYLFI